MIAIDKKDDMDGGQKFMTEQNMDNLEEKGNCKDTEQLCKKEETSSGKE